MEHHDFSLKTRASRLGLTAIALVGLVGLAGAPAACSSDNTSSSTISSIDITQGPCVVRRTESKKLGAEATRRDGSKENVTTRASWSTDNENTATVDDDGTVVGVSAGVTEVRVEFEGATTATECTVTP